MAPSIPHHRDSLPRHTSSSSASAEIETTLACDWNRMGDIGRSRDGSAQKSKMSYRTADDGARNTGCSFTVLSERRRISPFIWQRLNLGSLELKLGSVHARSSHHVSHSTVPSGSEKTRSKRHQHMPSHKASSGEPLPPNSLFGNLKVYRGVIFLLPDDYRKTMIRAPFLSGRR